MKEGKERETKNGNRIPSLLFFYLALTLKKQIIIVKPALGGRGKRYEMEKKDLDLIKRSLENLYWVLDDRIRKTSETKQAIKDKEVQIQIEELQKKLRI